jgi:hypothetical protein
VKNLLKTIVANPNIPRDNGKDAKDHGTTRTLGDDKEGKRGVVILFFG